MKKILIPIVTISFLITMLVVISSSFIDYGLGAKALIYQVLFCLLGLLYIINGFSVEKNTHKFVILLCGLFIVSMGFITRTFFINILGVIAILTPIIIRRLEQKPVAN